MLIAITGPMFSRKTSELISLARQHMIAENRVVAFKPSNDNRYSETKIVSHTGEELDAIAVDRRFPGQMIKRVHELEEYDKVDVICIDEAQFFDESAMRGVVSYFLYSLHKTIIVSGLSQDSFGEPFGAMPYILAVADDIIHKKAVCSSSKIIGAATRTFRKDTSDATQVVVGGEDIYEPRSFIEWIREL